MARGRGTFGLVPSRGRVRGSSTFRGRGRGRGRGGSRSGGDRSNAEPALERADDAKQTEDRFEDTRLADEIDEKLGFARFTEGPSREGWLVNMHPVSDAFSWSTLPLILDATTNVGSYKR